MKNKGLFALMALLAIALVGGTIGASASANGGASAAKKKKRCPAGTHKVVVKKHGKKKKKCVPNTNGGGNGSHTSLVRATLTWSNGGASDVDMDLFVFDGSGNVAGDGVDNIPNSSMSPDIPGPAGTQTFTDQAFDLKRPLSFGVCYQVSGSVHTDFTITYVTADGQTHTETRADDNSLTGGKDSPGSAAHFNYPGGPTIPSTYCPGTSLVP
jgi:hypothetical protein